jgi:hypothetical protein
VAAQQTPTAEAARGSSRGSTRPVGANAGGIGWMRGSPGRSTRPGPVASRGMSRVQPAPTRLSSVMSAPPGERRPVLSDSRSR